MAPGPQVVTPTEVDARMPGAERGGAAAEVCRADEVPAAARFVMKMGEAADAVAAVGSMCEGGG